MCSTMDRISTVISVFRSEPPKRMYWLHSVLYLDHSAPRHVGTLHKLEEALEEKFESHGLRGLA